MKSRKILKVRQGSPFSFTSFMLFMTFMVIQLRNLG